MFLTSHDETRIHVHDIKESRSRSVGLVEPRLIASVLGVSPAIYPRLLLGSTRLVTRKHLASNKSRKILGKCNTDGHFHLSNKKKTAQSRILIPTHVQRVLPTNLPHQPPSTLSNEFISSTLGLGSEAVIVAALVWSVLVRLKGIDSAPGSLAFFAGHRTRPHRVAPHDHGV